MNPENKKILQLSIFSIAMGFMESAIVLYLRKIYYPDGFAFPLAPIDPNIAIVEVFREVATIIMLLGIAFLAGTKRLQKIAFFIYCFAVWDLFYYVFLKVFLDWPQSFFTPDILFLIPVPWVGPVLAPCLVSLHLIILALCINSLQLKDKDFKINKTQIRLIVVGCTIIICSFMWDYLNYIHSVNVNAKIWTIMSSDFMFKEVSSYLPDAYNWWIFTIGFSMMTIGLLMILNKKK